MFVKKQSGETSMSSVCPTLITNIAIIIVLLGVLLRVKELMGVGRLPIQAS